MLHTGSAMEVRAIAAGLLKKFSPAIVLWLGDLTSTIQKYGPTNHEGIQQSPGVLSPGIQVWHIARSMSLQLRVKALPLRWRAA